MVKNAVSQKLYQQGGNIGATEHLVSLADELIERFKPITIDERIAAVNQAMREERWMTQIKRDLDELELGSGCGAQSEEFRKAGFHTKEFDKKTRSKDEDMTTVLGLLIIAWNMCRMKRKRIVTIALPCETWLGFLSADWHKRSKDHPFGDDAIDDVHEAN